MGSIMKKVLFIITGTLYPITIGRQIRTHNFVQALNQDSELYLLYQNWESDEKDDTSNFLGYFNKTKKISSKENRFRYFNVQTPAIIYSAELFAKLLNILSKRKK